QSGSSSSSGGGSGSGGGGSESGGGSSGSRSGGSPGVGVGVAISVNYADVINFASTGNTTISGNGLSVQATMTNVGGDATHAFAAESISGAGSAGVGVAGSFALNYVLDKTEAVVKGGAGGAAGRG